jgi:hypothetical protein
LLSQVAVAVAVDMVQQVAVAVALVVVLAVIDHPCQVQARAAVHPLKAHYCWYWGRTIRSRLERAGVVAQQQPSAPTGRTVFLAPSHQRVAAAAVFTQRLLANQVKLVVLAVAHLAP